MLKTVTPRKLKPSGLSNGYRAIFTLAVDLTVLAEDRSLVEALRI